MNLIPLSFILAGLLALPAAAAGSSPAPALVRLDQALSQTLQEKTQGRLAPERVAEFVTKFRADLAAAKAEAEPTPANADLQAHILTLLGELEPVAPAPSGAAAASASVDPKAALSQAHFDEKTTPKVIAEEKKIPWNSTANTDRGEQDGVFVSHGRRFRFASRQAAKSLLANLPMPPAPVNDSAPSNPVGLAALAALGSAGAMLLFGGWGGDEIEKRLPGTKTRMGLAAALGGVLATAGVFLVPATAPLVTQPAVTNEVPQMLARVIPLEPGVEISPMLGRTGEPRAFVTAAEDIVGLNSQELAQRLGIKPAQEFLAIRFPNPCAGLCTPLQFDHPEFIGRGLTSGGAREFLITNTPIPSGATIEVVK